MSHQFTALADGIDWCRCCGTARRGLEYFMVGDPHSEPEERERRKTFCHRHPDVTLKALYTWMEVLEKVGRAPITDLPSFRCQLEHSGLFQRLVNGKEPLPEPPPRAMSYPWYKLIEAGFEYTDSVWFWEERGEKNKLVVEQAAWTILETVIPEEEWIATYEVVDMRQLALSARALYKSVPAYIELMHEKDNPKTGNIWQVPTKLADTRWRVKHVGSQVYSHNGKTVRWKHNNGEWAKLWLISREPALEPVLKPKSAVAQA